LDALENFPFCAVIFNMSSAAIVTAVFGLLQEKKVVIISRFPGDLAIFIQTILVLLAPFTWPSGILSVLTPDLIDYLDAPFPYIVGVSQNDWKIIQNKKKENLDEEIVLIDLSTEQSVMHHGFFYNQIEHDSIVTRSKFSILESQLCIETI